MKLTLKQLKSIINDQLKEAKGPRKPKRPPLFVLQGMLDGRGDVDKYDASEALEEIKSKLTKQEYDDIKYAIGAAYGGAMGSYLGDDDIMAVEDVINRLKTAS